MGLLIGSLEGPSKAEFKVLIIRRVPSVVNSSPMISPRFSATTLWNGSSLCNRTARLRCLIALAACDASGRAEGAGATSEAGLLRLTSRRRAGRIEIGKHAEKLLRTRARHVGRCCSKDCRKANREGPFVSPAIGTKPVVVAAHRRPPLVMADLMGDREGKPFWPDLAMARQAAIDANMGGGRAQPERLGIQAIAIPRDIDGDIAEHDGKARDDLAGPFTLLRISRRPQTVSRRRYREHSSPTPPLSPPVREA